MASRALAAARDGPGRLPRGLRPPPGAGRAAGDPALAGRRCSTRRWPATGAASDLDAATDDACLELIAAHADKVDGIKVSLLDARARGRPARRAAAGRAPLHRRRLQLPRADRGDEQGSATRCSASSTRSRPRRPTALQRARRRRPRRASTRSSTPTVPLSRHLFARADPLLQDGRRLPGLAQRPPGALHDGRRARERPLARAPGRALPARRRAPACCATRRSRPRACGPAGAGRGRRVSIDAARLSLNQITADHLDLEAAVEACAGRGHRLVCPLAPQARPGRGRAHRRCGRRSW